MPGKNITIKQWNLKQNYTQINFEWIEEEACNVFHISINGLKSQHIKG